jgi:hypothetical protein
MKTIAIFGMELPVIKELGDGYFVVLHPNGPGLARQVGDNSSLSTLCILPHNVLDRKDESFVDAEDECDDGLPVPVEIASRAIEAYVDWSWPKCKPTQVEKA